MSEEKVGLQYNNVTEPLNELRKWGWSVAVHNDYRQDGEPHTFWLFTGPEGRCAKGEGRTDAEALALVRAAVVADAAVGPKSLTAPQSMPTGNGVPILELVLADLRAKSDAGTKKYGTPLKTENGRDALVDAYQEALDLPMYLRQEIEERRRRERHGEGRPVYAGGKLVGTAHHIASGQGEPCRKCGASPCQGCGFPHCDGKPCPADAKFSREIRLALGDPLDSPDEQTVANVAALVKSGREMEFELECPGTLVGVDLCGTCRACVTRERDALRTDVVALRGAVANLEDERAGERARVEAETRERGLPDSEDSSPRVISAERDETPACSIEQVRQALAMMTRGAEEGSGWWHLLDKAIDELSKLRAKAAPEPFGRVPPNVMMWCPFCGFQHVDSGEWATRVHHTHLCAGCGRTWRVAPAVFGAATATGGFAPVATAMMTRLQERCVAAEKRDLEAQAKLNVAAARAAEVLARFGGMEEVRHDLTVAIRQAIYAELTPEHASVIARLQHDLQVTADRLEKATRRLMDAEALTGRWRASLRDLKATVRREVSSLENGGGTGHVVAALEVALGAREPDSSGSP